MITLAISALTNPMKLSETCTIGRTCAETLKLPTSLLASTVNRTNHQPKSPLAPFTHSRYPNSVAINFIGPLPEDKGFDYIMTFTDRLGADIWIVPCKTTLTAEDATQLFFVNWYCENGLPNDIISDQDKLFLSHFWHALHKLTRIKLKLSMSYHPETDGASEQTNKMVNQSIQFFVEQNQNGWVKSLPLIHFNMMSMVNKSAGFSPFQLRLGCMPRILPPLVAIAPTSEAAGSLALEFLKSMHVDTLEAQDNLTQAKISQSSQTNRNRTLTFPFEVSVRATPIWT